MFESVSASGGALLANALGRILLIPKRNPSFVEERQHLSLKTVILEDIKLAFGRTAH